MATVEILDDDIRQVRDQISALHARRAYLASVLLSTPHLATRLQQRSASDSHLHQKATKAIKQQANRDLENTYRACAGVTAYRVQDPDPNAVDAGRILGVRIDVPVESKFVDTYHVLFNRPSTRHKTMLKIHRHTIPACIPVRQLANRHLPQPKRDTNESVEQDLIKFGRILRKELVSWHLRTAALEKLKGEAGLLSEGAKRREGREEPAYGKVLNAFVGDSEDEDEDEDEDFIEDERRREPVRITSIEADLAVREVTITWSSRQVAAVDITKDGEIVKGVVRAKDGSRVRDLEKKLLGRIEDLVDRIS